MGLSEENGFVTRGSRHSVDEIVASLSAILKTKGVTLFAVVDHSGEAARVGLTMRPTKLLIFGDPRAGTPVMLASPSVAIDLPLKILVWQDESGATQISSNTPAYLGARHRIPENLLKNISGVEALIAKAAD
jgi:uncharacterized protein (DUF302 family)